MTTLRLKEKLGQFVGRGDLVAEIQSQEMMEAAIEVSEKDVADVRIGHPVELRGRAFPGETLHGRVASIAPTVRSDAASPLGSRTVLVRSELRPTPLALRPGMSGVAKILVGERRLYERVVHRARRFLRIDVWAW